jgi:hypothetical protein
MGALTVMCTVLAVVVVVCASGVVAYIVIQLLSRT